ncbi:DNA-binding response regulator [Weizmannia sp. FSL K6-0777]|uniref:LuxR C-terminal-related transcriptional regulator n=1 Tax=Heyndrickxia TaxID=2837504 RepID=UPI002E1A5CD8|nr:DNA-binding response regulator [Weizmannia sp. CD-2023]
MNKKEISAALKDYHWMINEIQRQRKMLENEVGGNLTAQYGIDDTMPKGKGGTGDPIFREVIRREKKSKWIAKIEKKVLFIQEHINCVQGERERAVLECLLDGMSVIAISRHMGLSERHIFRIRDCIVDRMAEMSRMAGMSGFAGELREEKDIC